MTLYEELEQARETNRRLNRRCQFLEHKIKKYRQRVVGQLSIIKTWKQMAERDYRSAHATYNEVFKVGSRSFIDWWWVRRMFKGILTSIYNRLNTDYAKYEWDRIRKKDQKK